MERLRPQRPISLVAIAATAVLGGGLLGAFTNAVNGAVSPQYFRTILGWNQVDSIYRATIAQGVFEGLIYGTLMAIVLAIVIGTVTGARCRFAEVRMRLLGIAVGVLVCWGIGGCLAMGLATLSPEFYRERFRGVPSDFVPMLRYAWVGGSIWGAMFGALLSLAIGSVLIAADWKRTREDVTE